MLVEAFRGAEVCGRLAQWRLAQSSLVSIDDRSCLRMSGPPMASHCGHPVVCLEEVAVKLQHAGQAVDVSDGL